MFKYLIFSLLGVLSVVIFSASSALAAEFKSDQNTVVVGQSENVKDLYIFSGSSTISAPVKGDLVVLGGTVMADNNIEDSLFVAGGTVNLRGDVGRHARIAGGTVTISGKIKGDLMIAGGTVSLTDSSSVDGDLLIAGGMIDLNKTTIKGNTKITADQVSILGNYNNVWVNSDNTIDIKNGTTINGNFSYGSVKTANIESGATIKGSTDRFRSTAVDKVGINKFLSIYSLLMMLGSILLALILFKLIPRTFIGTSEIAFKKPYESMGIGIATAIIVPIVTLLIFFLIVGIPTAFLLGSILFLLFTVGSLFGKVFSGMLIIKLATREKDYKIDWLAISIGVIVVSMLGLIPYFGWVFTFLSFIWGFGALIQIVYVKLRAERLPASPIIQV